MNEGRVADVVVEQVAALEAERHLGGAVDRRVEGLGVGEFGPQVVPARGRRLERGDLDVVEGRAGG
ncbi:MAG: hypothetical protein PGN25_01600 [Methylorubrum populi]